MHAPCDATLLRIFIGYDDTYAGELLYDQIVRKARAMNMAGATVTRGIFAYGPTIREQQTLLALADNIPAVIEIVDSEYKIREFLPAIETMLESALVTTQKVAVARYGRGAIPR